MTTEPIAAAPATPVEASPSSGQAAQTETAAEGQAAATTAAPEEPRQKFIPVTRIALMDRLATEEKRTAGLAGPASCAKMFRYLSVWRHQTYQGRLAHMKYCFMPFSPDRDTKQIMHYEPEQLASMQGDLIEQVRYLLTQANYKHIDKKKLEELLQANSAHGLELTVDLGEFDEVLLFSRGLEVETVEKRVMDNLFLFKREFKVPTYSRLFVLLKLKSLEARKQEIMRTQSVNEKKALKIIKKKRRGLPDDPDGRFIYLRLFKDIPREDLEMMFPNTQVKLKLFDKIKLGVTAGGGTVAGLVGAAGKMAAAIATANPIALVAALAGVVGVIFRQIMSIFNTRTKYMMQLAQRLFFHSLANNRAVLTLLLDRAEEEDVKEEMLLYFFLLRHPMPRADIMQEGPMDEKIEAFIRREFGVIVDFDIEDALGRLEKDYLAQETADGMMRALQPGQACEHLENMWRHLMATPLEVKDDILTDGEV